MSQQAQLERAVLRLLAVVTEEGGAQWEDSPELTERALVDWLGQQEDRAEELRERIERKQREVVRAAEVEGEEWSPDENQFNRGLSSNIHPGPEGCNQREERRLGEGFPKGKRGSRGRHLNHN